MQFGSLNAEILWQRYVAIPQVYQLEAHRGFEQLCTLSGWASFPCLKISAAGELNCMAGASCFGEGECLYGPGVGWLSKKYQMKKKV